MVIHKFSRALFGSLLLLLMSFVIYFVRYPVWGWTIEPVFAVLILSYAVVLVAALALLKKDLKKSLSQVFRFHGFRLVFVGLGFALLFQVVWFGLIVGLGSRLDVMGFPLLRGYESYVYGSLPVAFAMYIGFAVFGAFAEEVAYRGYVQTQVSLNYGAAAGVVTSAVFFSLQHIHVFQLPWMVNFFQGQFINVMVGGLFSGYLFFKCRGDIWTVFAFHAVGNLFSVVLPVQVTYVYPWAYAVATVTSYVVLFGVTRFAVVHSLTDSIKNLKGQILVGRGGT